MTQYIANAGIDRLRELVAERITRESPSVVTTMEHCLVTPGAVASMASAFAVCLDPGTEVLVPDPGWPNYGLSATILGATLVPYPCPATNASTRWSESDGSIRVGGRVGLRVTFAAHTAAS